MFRCILGGCADREAKDAIADQALTQVNNNLNFLKKTSFSFKEWKPSDVLSDESIYYRGLLKALSTRINECLTNGKIAGIDTMTDLNISKTQFIGRQLGNLITAQMISMSYQPSQDFDLTIPGENSQTFEMNFFKNIPKGTVDDAEKNLLSKTLNTQLSNTIARINMKELIDACGRLLAQQVEAQAVAAASVKLSYGNEGSAT